jgi:hypothetical protein
MTNDPMNAHLAAAERHLQDAASFADETEKRAILDALRAIRALKYNDAALDLAIKDSQGITERTGARMADYLRSGDVLRDILKQVPPPT